MENIINEPKWERVETVSGDIYPELIRGLLESSGIPVILSQEGAGKSAYHFSVGPLSEVDIIVPSEFLDQAKELIDAFFAGKLENNNEEDDHGIDDDKPSD
ncbi:MAG: DUF2007 domain-containing protein [Chloroflexi bacterium]|nr:DUF2007 domain-containing protein [Chloroflexota bacterium]